MPATLAARARPAHPPVRVIRMRDDPAPCERRRHRVRAAPARGRRRGDDDLPRPVPGGVDARAGRAAARRRAPRRVVREQRPSRGDRRRLLPARPVATARRAAHRWSGHAERADRRAVGRPALLRARGRRRDGPDRRRLRRCRRSRTATSCRPARCSSRAAARWSTRRPRGVLGGRRAVRLGHPPPPGTRAARSGSPTAASSRSAATGAAPASTAGSTWPSSRGCSSRAARTTRINLDGGVGDARAPRSPAQQALLTSGPVCTRFSTRSHRVGFRPSVFLMPS